MNSLVPDLAMVPKLFTKSGTQIETNISKQHNLSHSTVLLHKPISDSEKIHVNLPALVIPIPLSMIVKVLLVLSGIM